MSTTEQPTISPATMLLVLRARYDCGAVPQGVWEVIKGLEAHLAWLEHIRAVRRRP
jgi:hypothetical protein